MLLYNRAHIEQKQPSYPLAIDLRIWHNGIWYILACNRIWHTGVSYFYNNWLIIDRIMVILWRKIKESE
jgi:uncharacterized circularly permuted ATP-grasp superfamily protein